MANWGTVSRKVKQCPTMVRSIQYVPIQVAHQQYRRALIFLCRTACIVGKQEVPSVHSTKRPNLRWRIELPIGIYTMILNGQHGRQWGQSRCRCRLVTSSQCEAFSRAQVGVGCVAQDIRRKFAAQCNASRSVRTAGLSTAGWTFACQLYFLHDTTTITGTVMTLSTN